MVSWYCIHRLRPAFNGHVLLLANNDQLVRFVGEASTAALYTIEFILVLKANDSVVQMCFDKLQKQSDYKLYQFSAPNDIVFLRAYLRQNFQVKFFGRTFVLFRADVSKLECINEWCVFELEYPSKSTGILELNLPLKPIHDRSLLVFDLDNTLIGDCFPSVLRDHRIPQFLTEYRNRHIVVLWSYGNAHHVNEAMREAGIDRRLFHLIMTGGHTSEEGTMSFTKRRIKFPTTISGRLPKSVGPVLSTLYDLGMEVGGTTVLVDDLADNNFNYDYHVIVSRFDDDNNPPNDWDSIDINIQSVLR
ncbi:CUN087 similar to AcMNPV ORF98 [Culex nigripalpus nucleopolyhedrovirus]|uniref:CUN087 similar to AcMNPV ORF98 n=1 Tax=Culex nigripalpus nucleopolyhedrovirus (isolate Florida/1997) TaxID=645993 RepID=Q919I8_NPVCO|nr:CUN087 similar to AcMNPV ORF98 [Culex nigripalpus nucleopolyhedrovirus]AAK94165.1 CUN087 similar to AcMNPV ORF98 [Culex nigripalpus nucleopolyhedrovirus]